MARQIQGSQRDFSFGEVDPALKRSDDHPARKAGLRQMSNMRILNSGAIQNRPGRRALFVPSVPGSRVEEVVMETGATVFRLVFLFAVNGLIRIYNAAGILVIEINVQGNLAPLPWDAAGVPNIVYAVLRNSIYITYPGMRPQVLSWDGVATWTLADYTELVVGNQKRTPFYRISPQGVAITPSAQTGNINLLASSALFTNQWPGTRIRYIGRQILITAFLDLTHATGTVEEALPGSQIINFATDPAVVYSIGDEVIGSVSNAKGLVTGFAAVNNIIVQLLTTNTSTSDTGGGAIGGLPGTGSGGTSTFAFLTADHLAGPGGTLGAASVSTINAPQACAVWDEEVMNALHGYPESCFVDQFRLGFCSFPGLPGAIAWSAINSPNDLYVGASPANAMLEIVPDKVRVRYVLPGAESSEFVLCDGKLYYIKIDAANPLKPGSVSFQVLSSDGCAQVQPRATQDIILYVNAGRNSVMAITASGAYYRPFDTKNLTEFHGHLFNNIAAIAAPNADGTFNERYAYVLNGDGTLVCGKYSIKAGDLAGMVGWGPWAGAGVPQWVSARGAVVLFSTMYFGLVVCEALDDTLYLDCAIFVNAAPAAMAPPPGQGPLWLAALQNVALMDQGTRSMGPYQIDSNGAIFPQFNGGEDLNAVSLVAGQPWTSTVEPFCPDAQSGADMHQRMTRRRVSNFVAYVLHSTGFLMGRLFSSNVTATSPALGTVMNQRRFTAYNQDDDATLPPPSRETTYSIRPAGRSFDPRVAIIKDTPGPLQILEIGIEVTL